MNQSDTIAANPDVYGSAVEGIILASSEFRNKRLGHMNEVADAIIENGNVTVKVEEFALAIHGVVEYQSFFIRQGELLVDPDEEESAERYDSIEQSVKGISSQIMLSASRFRSFAMQPLDLWYPFEGEESWRQQPLRFIIRNYVDYDHRSNQKAYLGDVLLPVLSLDDKSQEVKPDAIHIARFERNSTRLEAKERLTSNFRAEWKIGKAAAVAAGIENYGTTLEQDIAFLERLQAATETLTAPQHFSNDAWDEVLRQSLSSGGAD